MNTETDLGRDRSWTRAHATQCLYCNEKCAQRELMKYVHVTMYAGGAICVLHHACHCQIHKSILPYYPKLKLCATAPSTCKSVFEFFTTCKFRNKWKL